MNGRIEPETRSKFLMHYSLQHFFDNGGGSCWIVSTGGYESTRGRIQASDLKAGLAATGQINETTLYVFPEAQGLDSPTDCYGANTDAIDLCVELQDRFTVTDVRQDPELPADGWRANIKTLRDLQVDRILSAPAGH